MDTPNEEQSAVPENETNEESSSSLAAEAAPAAPVAAADQKTYEQNGTTDTVESDPNNSENCNPDKMPEELKDIFLVDAIGDTLYSKRFVLQTLVNLNKVESKLSEEFEKDLCTLWDMTVEKDVVKLLLEHNVLEIFSSLIQMSEDQRLVEILLGIIGNMCSLSQTREALCQQPDVMIPIIDLISCSDSLILIQLMRLFHTCLVFENSGDEYIWFQHFRCADQFVDRFAFLLANSMSTTLLVHAYEALNAICTKFTVIEIQPEIADSSGFRDVFVKPALVSGVIEAFKQMLPDMPRIPNDKSSANGGGSVGGGVGGEGDDAVATGAGGGGEHSHAIDDDLTAPTKRTQRIMNLFLDINVILSQYDSTSQKCYEPFLPQLMECIYKCLQPLCHPVYLLPLSSNEQILIENVNELIQALNDPFNVKCFQQMITIWSLIEGHLAKLTKKQSESKSEWDDDDVDGGGADCDDEEVSGIDVNMTILEYITRTSKNATQQQIEACVKNIKQDIIESLCKALAPGSGEDDIRACIDKFKEAARSIWEIEITINEDEFGRRSVSDFDDDDDDEVEEGSDYEHKLEQKQQQIPDDNEQAAVEHSNDNKLNQEIESDDKNIQNNSNSIPIASETEIQQSSTEQQHRASDQ